MRGVIKIIGFLVYLVHFISGLLDDSSNTPKEVFSGLQPWEDWYYPVIIIEYIIFLPLWMIIWNHTLGPFLEGIFKQS